MYFIGALIAVAFGLHGHYRAAVRDRQLLLKDDTIHTQAAALREMRTTNAVLQNSTYLNADRINRLFDDVEELKGWRDTCAKLK